MPENATDRLQVRCDFRSDAVIVSADGQIDLATIAVLEQNLERACARATPKKPLIVDLSEVEFLASCGLEVLVEQCRRCTRDGVLMRVVAARTVRLRPPYRHRSDDLGMKRGSRGIASGWRYLLSASRKSFTS